MDATWSRPEGSKIAVVSIAMTITHASSLTDSQLLSELPRLAHGEREATVALIAHLAEFHARRLFAGEGFPSTFKYCREVLRLSEDAAFNRIEAARATRRFPVVLDMLTAGTLSPTTARMLARHLTADNHAKLLAAAAGKSKQEVEKLLAALFPQADVPASIRKMRVNTVTVAEPVTTVTPLATMATGQAEPALLPVLSAATAERPAAAPTRPTPRPVVRPIAAERYEVRFTATAATREKLRRAQDLLGHAVPSGDLAEVFDRALTLLVADLERKKFAATKRRGKSRGQSEDSRNVPADVDRAVSRRDEGRCAFIARNGRRCNERRFLEFHHVVPYAAGGKPTVDNIQLRCRAHNRYEATLFFGPGREYGGVSEATRSGTGNPAIGRPSHAGTPATG
jgi:HNH endonuclease